MKSLYKWEISNFCVNCQKANEAVLSSLFSSHGMQWEISLMPRGNAELDENYCSIYLYRITPSDIIIHFKFSVLDRDNKMRFSQESGLKLFNKKNSSWGFNNFINHSVFNDKRKEILNNGKLTILCEILTNSCKLIKEEDEPDLEKSFNAFPSYETYFLNRTLSDVQFILDKDVFFAHKFALATRSEVFAAMFAHEMKENTENKVKIENVDGKVFKEMLRYVYTGEVNDIEIMINDLLSLADKYMLEGLKRTCENKLINNISSENIYDHITVASRYSLPKLQRKAIKYVVSNSDDILSNITTDLIKFE